MSRLFVALLALPAAAVHVERITRGNLAIEGIPEIPQELKQRMRRYQFVRSADFAGWTPDGRVTISSRFDNTSQPHVVDKPIRGGKVWYLVGLNEGHGFARRDDVDYYQWAVALFLEKLKQ